MVGVKTWEDEQIALILTCKEQGKTVSEIIGLLKARWPRKVVKDSGVRYVMTNYKQAPQIQTTAVGSKPRSSQANKAGRASQKRPNPNKQPKSTLNRAATQASKFRTQTSLFSPNNSLFPPMCRVDRSELAAQMREVSGGPITASFDTPQPLNILNSPVHSRTKLLTHAQQAEDIGVDAIARGQQVPASSPGAQSIMASPAPQPPATGYQSHTTIPKGFQTQDMHRTVSMPQYDSQGHPVPHNISMNGQQHHYIGHPSNRHMGAPNIAGTNPQFRGNLQNMAFPQGQFGRVAANGAANIDFNGMPVSWFGLPVGYNPQSGMTPPSMVQQIYNPSILPNFASVGPFGGNIPGSMPFNQPHNPGQFTHPVNNGQYRQNLPQIQRPESRMGNIDPQLSNPAPFMGTPQINQTAVMAINGSRPPTRNEPTSTPRPNHIPQSMAQQTHGGAIATPHHYHTNRASISSEVNIPGNLTTRGNRDTSTPTPTPAAPQPSHSLQSRDHPGERAQNKASATSQANDPKNLTPQDLLNTLNQQGAQAQSGASTTARANNPASAESQDIRNRATPQTNPSGSSPRQGLPKKPVIILENPIFDLPFKMPSTNEGWNLLLMEHGQKGNRNAPYPADLYSKIYNGQFELRIVNPVFKGGIVWDQSAHASVTPNNDLRTSPPDATTNLNAPAASKQQSDELGAPHNPSTSEPTRDANQQASATQAPVAGPAQGKPMQNSRNPPTSNATSLNNQATPSMSPLGSKGVEALSTPIASVTLQRPGMGQRYPSHLGTQSSSNSQKSHYRPTAKRAAPASEQEESPPKRHKTSGQDTQASVEGPRPVLEQPNEYVSTFLISGQPEFTNFSSLPPEKEHLEWAKGIRELHKNNPPNTTQSLPSEHNNSPAEPQGCTSSRQFNPRPSGPIQDSEPLNSSHRQYSAAVARTQQSMKQQVRSGQQHGLVKPTNGGILGFQTFSDVSPLPQMQAGLPTLEQSPPRGRLQANANAESNCQQKAYQHQSDFLDGGAANTEQELDDYDFDSLIDMDLVLTSVPAMDNDMNVDSAIAAAHVGDETPEQDPNTSSSSESNLNPSPKTPAQTQTEADLWDDIMNTAAFDPAALGDDEFSQLLDQFQSTGGDYADLVDVKCEKEPAKRDDGLPTFPPGSLMAGFGKFDHGSSA